MGNVVYVVRWDGTQELLWKMQLDATPQAVLCEVGLAWLGLARLGSVNAKEGVQMMTSNFGQSEAADQLPRIHLTLSLDLSFMRLVLAN